MTALGISKAVEEEAPVTYTSSLHFLWTCVQGAWVPHAPGMCAAPHREIWELCMTQYPEEKWLLHVDLNDQEWVNCSLILQPISSKCALAIATESQAHVILTRRGGDRIVVQLTQC